MNKTQKLFVVGGLVLGAQLAVVTYQNALVIRDLSSLKKTIDPIKARLKNAGLA